MSMADNKLDSVSPQDFSNESYMFTTMADFEHGKNGLHRILATHFQMLHGYSNIHILWDAAQNELSMFLNDNAFNTADDLWEFIQYAFGHKFVLSRPHIWQYAPNYPQKVRGLVINLANQNGGVISRSQIDNYFSRIKIRLPINQELLSNNELLFCDKATFMTTQSLSSRHLSALTDALEKLFAAENVSYIVLRDIIDEWFWSLPQLAASWTPLLLQEILRVFPNVGFRVIPQGVKGQAFDTIGVAIVPDKSGIISFADVVHSYCHDEYQLPHKILAKELRHKLRDARMLEGDELAMNMNKALKDYRFSFDSEKKFVTILER